jgi:hypothetical protein
MHNVKNQHTRDDYLRNGNKSILLMLLIPFIKFLIPALFIAITGYWAFNVLSEATIFNSKEIYYAGVNPWTGKDVVVKGCRPSRLREDGTCNKKITINNLKEGIPTFRL